MFFFLLTCVAQVMLSPNKQLLLILGVYRDNRKCLVVFQIFETYPDPFHVIFYDMAFTYIDVCFRSDLSLGCPCVAHAGVFLFVFSQPRFSESGLHHCSSGICFRMFVVLLSLLIMCVRVFQPHHLMVLALPLIECPHNKLYESSSSLFLSATAKKNAEHHIYGQESSQFQVFVFRIHSLCLEMINLVAAASRRSARHYWTLDQHADWTAAHDDARGGLQRSQRRRLSLHDVGRRTGLFCLLLLCFVSDFSCSHLKIGEYCLWKMWRGGEPARCRFEVHPRSLAPEVTDMAWLMHPESPKTRILSAVFSDASAAKVAIAFFDCNLFVFTKRFLRS